MKLVFLGTGCSNPTKARNLSSAALQFNGEWILFDCAEGTQRQMVNAGVSYLKINHIFITHFHADHTLGLPGLIATMAIHERNAGLHIYGPEGISQLVNLFLKVASEKIPFKISCHEIRRAGKILEEEKYSIAAVPLAHRIKCFGFVFKEKDKEGTFMREKAEKLGIPVGPLYSKLAAGETVKVGGKIFKPEDVMDYKKRRAGKKISYISDTMPNEKYFKEIEDSDILIHEASFAEDLEKRAKETAHCTAKEAAQVAEKTRAKKLILTHISPRYKDDKKILAEAKEIFKNSVAAKDLMEIEL